MDAWMFVLSELVQQTFYQNILQMSLAKLDQ